MRSIPPFPSQWLEVLAPWGGNTALDAVLPGLLADSAREVIYPQPQDLWRALELCPPDAVKVVILGQDPYHGPGQAHGLAFSVPPGVAEPPSLRNLFKEFVADTGHTRASLCRGDAVYLAGLFVPGFVCDLPRDDPLAAQPHSALIFYNHFFEGAIDVGAQA